MKPTLSIAALLVLSVLVCTRAVAQGGSSQTPLSRYDPRTETTVSGTVEDVTTIPDGSAVAGAGGLHVTIRADAKTVEVDLGPAWFVRGRQFTFTKGETITVTGSKTTRGETTAIIARAVKKGDRVLTLRNANGVPLWSGRGRS